MNAIISIKPEYVAEIRAGWKRYEFRKAVFKQQVDKVYIYASAPISKVVGEFQPVDILSGEPMDIWKKTKRYSGITELRIHGIRDSRSYGGTENGERCKK